MLTDTTTFYITGTGGLTVAAPLQNANAGANASTLIETGSGLLNLTASNNYTGGTIVNGGTLELSNGDPGNLLGGTTVTVNSGATLLGNATDPLNYNGGGFTAVKLVVNDGTMYENAGFRATMTSLNMTGGTLSSGAGFGAAGNNYSLSGTWTVTSDAAGNAALVNATAVGLNGGTLTVNRGAASPAVDMVISSAIVNYNASTLFKNGAGILQLTGSSNYSGGTVLAGGSCRWAIPRPWG